MDNEHLVHYPFAIEDNDLNVLKTVASPYSPET